MRHRPMPMCKSCRENVSEGIETPIGTRLKFARTVMSQRRNASRHAQGKMNLRDPSKRRPMFMACSPGNVFRLSGPCDQQPF